MQIGSLVVVKSLWGYTAGRTTLKGELIEWCPIDDEKTIYTLRSSIDNGIAWTFEEGVIGKTISGRELGIRTEWLKEVQPPMDISEIIEDAIYEVVETKLKH